MPVFQYEGVNQDGKPERGLLQGASLETVAKQLGDRGIQVNQLALAPGSGEIPVAGSPPPTEARTRMETDVVGPLVGGVPLTQLHFFFRQLGTMLHAGINPVQSFETLSRQTNSPKLRAVVLETKDHVLAGRPISVGFQRYPEVFTPLMLSMVRAGEEGGFLAEQCRQLAEYIQRDVELRNLIRRETAYPKIVIAASIVIILATNVIISAVKPGASGLNAPVLLWIVTGGLLLAGFLFARVGRKNPGVRASWDRFVQNLPGVGGMIHGFAMAKFGRAFGALYKGGVPLGKSVKLAADACGNEHVRGKIYPAADRMDSGAGIANTLAETGAFSPIVLDMTRTGEMTGNVDEMLIKMAEYYEDEGQTRARQAAMILGVVCFLLVAIYVGYIVVTFYTGFASGQMAPLNEEL